MNKNTHYDILGVSQNSTSTEIKKAYRKLSFQYHPDRNKSPDAADKFKDINNSYQVLSDENKRKMYDKQLIYGLSDEDISIDEFSDINNIFSTIFKDAMKSQNSGSNANLFSSIFKDAMNNPNDINGQSSFAFFMPGMMPGMMPPGMMPPGMTPPNKTNNNNIPNFVSELFGGPPPNFQECITPEPVIIEHIISFEESYTGTNHPITFERWVIINTRRVYEKKTIYVDIKPGINDNEVIIIENEGNHIDKNNIGSLEIIICIDINKTPFERDGNNIIFKKTISFKESLCGFSFVLDHISGKSFTFNNNNDEKCTLIYNGFKKTIPNYGFTRDNNTGSLIIIFEVEYPNGLSSEQIKSIREII